MIRRCAVSVLALGLASSLVACSSSGSDHDKKSTSPTSSPTAKKSAPVAIPTQPTKVPTNPPNVPKDRKNVAVTSCKAISGGWTSGGTAKNTTGSSVTYDITVFFTTNPGGTVLGYGSKKVTVAASGTESWTISDKFPAEKTMQCVLRGVAVS